MRSGRWWRRVLGWGAAGLLTLSAVQGRARAEAGDGFAVKKHAQHFRAFTVQEGVLTMDGLTVKTHVNLRTVGLQYLFIDLPAVGIVRVSELPFAGAEEQKAAFHGNALTLHAGGRRLELTAANRMRRTRSAYVRFDPGAGRGHALPSIGYGDASMQSIVWSGEETASVSPARRVRVSGRRSPRTAKLCQPSKSGRERCAVVREVLYRP